MISRLKSATAALPFLAGLACAPLPALATPIMEADLSSFTVLGASTVTNVPTSSVRGNVGVSPGTSITGFNSTSGLAVSDPQVTDGLVHSDTALAQSAQTQLTTSRNYLDSLGSGTLLSADLAGQTLSPGVYTVPAGTTNLSGTLTLDGGGNANAAWVFQMPSTLITSPNAVVDVTGTGSGAGLFWNVGSSATLDTNTTFMGNILASESITANTGATNLCGRLLADTAAVTLDQNSLSGICDGALSGSEGLSGGLDVTEGGEVVPRDFAAVPLPGAFALLAFGLAGLVSVGRRRAAA
ncbi:MAG: ice-binding family protein [Pseudomonadota bacterium]